MLGTYRLGECVHEGRTANSGVMGWPSMPNNGKNGRKRRRRIILGGIILLVLIGVGYGVTAALRPDNKIDPSKLATVEKGDLARSVVATGKIQPLATVEVKSKASGIVEKIFVDSGDRVKAGQVLVELDKQQLQAAEREAEATLQAAQAALASSQATYERNEAEAEGPDVPFLKTSLDRAVNLHKDGLIAQSVLEDADKAYQLALNKQIISQRNMAVSRADVERAKAQVAQAQAALERARQDLMNATVLSPIDGLVLSRDVQVGSAVSSILVLGSQATLVMTLGDVSDVYVLGRVDEADIGKVYLDQPARIVVESFKDKKFEGKVTKISPLGKEKDNVTTFEVRVSIHNPGGELKSQMTANAEIILEEKKGILLIPEAAVIYDKDRNASVEIPDGKAEKGRKKLPVKLGISNGVKTELLSGLTEKQKVILQ
jgi:HlyD family secretion protein